MSGFEHHASLVLGICGIQGVIRIQVDDPSTVFSDACICDCDDDTPVLEEGHGLQRDSRKKSDHCILYGHSHPELFPQNIGIQKRLQNGPSC